MFLPKYRGKNVSFLVTAAIASTIASTGGDLGLARDRLTVGHLRGADVRLDLELATHAVNEDVEVKFAHALDDLGQQPRGVRIWVDDQNPPQRRRQLRQHTRIDSKQDAGLRKQPAFPTPPSVKGA